MLNSEKLQLALAARERAEKKQQEYEDRLRAMEEQVELSQANLSQAQDMIRRLEQQLKELQAAKDDLENRQKELQAMLQRLEDAKHMETAERNKLEEEIKAKQVEVQRIQEEVEAKDNETRRLQEEVEEARRQQVTFFFIKNVQLSFRIKSIQNGSPNMLEYSVVDYNLSFFGGYPGFMTMRRTTDERYQFEF